MRIDELTSSRNVLTARPGDTLGLALQMMVWSGVHHLPVVRDGHPIGMLSLGDILRHQTAVGLQRGRLDEVTRAMTTPAITIAPDEPVAAAMAKMVARRIRALPVVADDVLCGIVTRTDLLRHQLEVDLTPKEGPTRTAADIMTTAPAVAGRATSLLDAATYMARCGIRHLPIVDEQNRLEGMLSDRDLRAAVGDPNILFLDERARAAARDRHAGEVMSLRCVSLPDSAPLATVIQSLLRDRVGAIPIVDRTRKLLGIVSYLDVLKTLQ
jgi:CBS domain-containing protein